MALSPSTTTEQSTSELDDEPTGHPLRAIAPRALIAIAVLTYVSSPSSNEAIGLFLIAFTGVITIVSDSRFAFERWLDDHHIPSREAWVSLLVIAAMLWSGYADTGDIFSVIRTNGDVVAFILAFAVVSDGLGRCGFFHFMAFRLADRCRGNTARLILYLFLLSSILTYFTSNDIVILTMTPIVVSVAYQTRMRNAKLLLLSQFVAANTISMGLLIGSPTNLILGREVGLNFLQYAVLMSAATVVSFMVSFVFVTRVNTWIARREERRSGTSTLDQSRTGPGSWIFDERYSALRTQEHREFTPEMRRWILMFAASVVILAVATTIEVSLLWAAIPIATIGLFMIARSRPGVMPRQAARQSMDTIKALPFGILFFGLAYFLVAQQLGVTPTVQDTIVPKARDLSASHSPLSSIATIGVTGVLVNTMNDLPAAAVSGQVLTQVVALPDGNGETITQFDKALTFQGVLTGLNIGTYVTPIGALAGLIWFEVMRRERRRYRNDPVFVSVNLHTPKRADLVIYGVASFVVSMVAIGLANWSFIVAVDYLMGPSTGGSKIDQSPMIVIPSLMLLVILPIMFRNALVKNGVALTHLGDFFVVLTRFRLFVARHRLVSAMIGIVLVFLISSFALYEIELIHHSLYPTAERAFDSPREFASWLIVFVSSGFESSRFPISVLGKVVAAMLALGGFAIIISIIKLSGSSSNDALRRRIASGEMQNPRILLLQTTDRALPIIQGIVRTSSRFVVVAGEAHENGEIIAWLDGHVQDRSFFLPWSGHRAVVDDFDLAQAHEVVMFSSSRSDDLANVNLLLDLDRRIFTGVVREFASEMGPKFVVQFTTTEMVDYFKQRVGREMLARVQIIHLGDEFAKFIAAKFTTALGSLEEFYSIRSAAIEEDFALAIDLEALNLELVIEEASSSPLGATGPVDGAIPLGVRVSTEGRSFTLARPSMSRLVPTDGSLERILGRLEVPSARIAPLGDPTTPLLVGWSDVAESVAHRLLVDRGSITMFVPAGAPVSKRLTEDPRVTTLMFHTAGELVTELVSNHGGVAMLVFDGDPRHGVSIDAVLEHLSFVRAENFARGESAPPIFVQCDSERRREEISRFVVTEIIDSTWIDASYLTAFLSAYFTVRSKVEATTTTADDVQPDLQIANVIASALMHFETSVAQDFEFAMPAGDSGSVVGATFTEATELGLESVGWSGSLVGVVSSRFEQQRLIVSIEYGESDRRISDHDLLLMVRHI